MLSSEDLSLFRGKVRFIDRKVQPGLTKLLWLTKGASNYFINDCLLHIDKVAMLTSLFLFKFSVSHKTTPYPHCAVIVSLLLSLFETPVGQIIS